MRWPLVAVAMLTSAPAVAGWQGAEWGMTVDAAAARVRGMSHEDGRPAYSSSRHQVRLSGPYSAGNHRFRADLAFNSDGKLDLVELMPTDMGKCWPLRADLRDRYGVPHEAPSNAIVDVNRWRVPAENNVVEITIMKGGSTTCVLKYRPLSTANTRGL